MSYEKDLSVLFNHHEFSMTHVDYGVISKPPHKIMKYPNTILTPKDFKFLFEKGKFLIYLGVGGNNQERKKKRGKEKKKRGTFKSCHIRKIKVARKIMGGYGNYL